jgi:uncharacterized protein DUF1707
MSTEYHTSPPNTGPSPVRASDAEREAVVAQLHEALGDGRLDLDETEERVAAAYAARHRSDLPPLLSDLPPSHAVGSVVPTWAALWGLAVWRIRIMLLGLEDAGDTPPTLTQRRLAAVLTVVAVLFVLVCAFLGAALAGR